MSDRSFFVSAPLIDRPAPDPLMEGRVFWAIDTKQMFQDAGDEWTTLIETNGPPDVVSMRTLGPAPLQAAAGNHVHSYAIPAPSAQVGDYVVVGAGPVTPGASHGIIFKRDWDEVLVDWEYQFVDQHGDTITAIDSELAVIDPPISRIAKMTLEVSGLIFDSASSTVGYREPGGVLTVEANDGLGNVTVHSLDVQRCTVESLDDDEKIRSSGRVPIPEALRSVLAETGGPDQFTFSVYASEADRDSGSDPLASIDGLGLAQWSYNDLSDWNLSWEMEENSDWPDNADRIQALITRLYEDRDEAEADADAEAEADANYFYELVMDWWETPPPANQVTSLVFQGSGLEEGSEPDSPPHFTDVSWKLHSLDLPGRAVADQPRARTQQDTLGINADGTGLELKLGADIPPWREGAFAFAGTPDRYTFEIYASEAARDCGLDPIASVSGTVIHDWDAEGAEFEVHMSSADPEIGTAVPEAVDALADDRNSISLDYFYQVTFHWDKPEYWAPPPRIDLALGETPGTVVVDWELSPGAPARAHYRVGVFPKHLGDHAHSRVLWHPDPFTPPKTIWGLRPGVTYTVRVSTRVRVWQSPAEFSDKTWKDITIPEPPALSPAEMRAPKNLRAEPGPGRRKLRVIWDNPSGFDEDRDSYELQYRKWVIDADTGTQVSYSAWVSVGVTGRDVVLSGLGSFDHLVRVRRVHGGEEGNEPEYGIYIYVTGRPG